MRKGNVFENLDYSDKDIEKWLDEIDKCKNTIEIIKTVRDKIYAHSDFNNIDPDLSIEIKDLKKLIDIAHSIISELYKDILKCDLDLSVDFEKKDFILLEALNRDFKERQKNNINMLKNIKRTL